MKLTLSVLIGLLLSQLTWGNTREFSIQKFDKLGRSFSYQVTPLNDLHNPIFQQAEIRKAILDLNDQAAVMTVGDIQKKLVEIYGAINFIRPYITSEIVQLGAERTAHWVARLVFLTSELKANKQGRKVKHLLSAISFLASLSEKEFTSEEYGTCQGMYDLRALEIRKSAGIHGISTLFGGSAVGGGAALGSVAGLNSLGWISLSAASSLPVIATAAAGGFLATLAVHELNLLQQNLSLNKMQKIFDDLDNDHKRTPSRKLIKRYTKNSRKKNKSSEGSMSQLITSLDRRGLLCNGFLKDAHHQKDRSGQIKNQIASFRDLNSFVKNYSSSDFLSFSFDHFVKLQFSNNQEGYCHQVWLEDVAIKRQRNNNILIYSLIADISSTQEEIIKNCGSDVTVDIEVHSLSAQQLLAHASFTDLSLSSKKSRQNKALILETKN